MISLCTAGRKISAHEITQMEDFGANSGLASSKCNSIFTTYLFKRLLWGKYPLQHGKLCRERVIAGTNSHPKTRVRCIPPTTGGELYPPFVTLKHSPRLNRVLTFDYYIRFVYL